MKAEALRMSYIEHLNFLVLPVLLQTHTVTHIDTDTHTNTHTDTHRQAGRDRYNHRQRPTDMHTTQAATDTPGHLQHHLRP